MNWFARKTAMVAIIASIAPLGCGTGHEHHEGERAEADDGLPGQSVTLWTDRTELFMEHKPFIVGQEVSFAAHVTEMPSFKAVTEGTVTLEVKMSDGTTLSGRVDKAASPGIFRPTITPTKAGSCEMSMTIEGPQLTDRFAIGSCEVYADDQSAIAALGDEAETSGQIPFLKEQQWQTSFATAPAQTRELQAGVLANGEIRPVAGKEARLTAAAGGRVLFTGDTPVLGMAVKKRQLLAKIAVRLSAGGDIASLNADVESTRAELAAAEAQLARAERLHAEKAIPLRRVEEARTRVSVAKARSKGASGRLSQHRAGAAGTGAAGSSAFQVRSPIAGSLGAVEFSSGETAVEGLALVSVIDMERVWLVARVFEPDIPRVEGARSAWFTIDGYDDAFTVDQSNGKLVSIGRVIDPKTRTIPVIFELDNSEGKLRIGQFAKISIATGAPEGVLAIPASALLDDGGKSIAYVMVEGEAFERRTLTLGIRSNGWVQVIDGVEPGERVVTKGGYEIKLAAASGVIPKHGHAH